MLLRIDAETVDKLDLVTVSAAYGDQRRYYATRTGPRLLVVCRGGLLLTDLVGATVDAALGWDKGAAGFVWRPGLRHSKVTLYRRAEGRASKTLGTVWQQAPGKRVAPQADTP